MDISTVMFNEYIIENSLLRISLLSIRSGLFPFIISNDGFLQVSLLQLVSSFIVVVSSVVLVTIAFSFMMVEESWVSNFISFGSFLFHSLYPLVSISELFIKLDQLSYSVAKLKLVSRVVFPFRNSLFRHTRVYLLSNIILLSAIYSIHFCSRSSFLLLEYVFLGLVFEHVLFVIIIIDKFSGFIGLVTSLLNLCSDELSFLSKSKSRKDVKRFERLAWGHDKLCDCAKLILDSHSFQIFLIINVCLIVCVVQSYVFIIRLSKQYWSILLVLCNLGTIAMHLNMAWRIIDTCEKLKNEVIIT